MTKAGEEAGDDQVTIRSFHHPYTPYDIQETFMETVYRVLEEAKVGILESPTGTGKSLSLICGALTWLRDFKGRQFEDGLNWGEDDSDEPEWIIEQARARKRQEMLRSREDLEHRLAKIRVNDKAERDRYMRGEQHHKKRKIDVGKSDDDDDEQYELDDYESDREQTESKFGGLESGLSAETIALLRQAGIGLQAPKEEDEEVEDEIKIFYCSRTHSQLTQFINEVRRPKFPPTIKDNSPNASKTEDLKHVTLGSRKNLCINPSVNKLNSLTAINERCAELQKSGTAKEHKCKFMPTAENKTLVNTYRDHALASIRDIEDMGSLGKEIGICPYYASRSAIKPAELITLPYPLLLQKSAREALGISLKGHVVIVDEAHNLMDAIAGIHGVEVSLKQLKMARSQLGTYLQKFRNRLKGKNRVYIAQVVRVIDSLAVYLESKLALPNSDGLVFDKDLLSGKGVDQINLFKLIRYLQEIKLARKVEGYVLHTELPSPPPSTKLITNPAKSETSAPVLHHIASLLSALTHPSKEGALFFSKTQLDNITLKYLLLNPAPEFESIVRDARAVILAGGTMSPMSDYTSHLFPYLAPATITTLSCGHVIPPENLMAWNLSKGPRGVEFNFTFKNRQNNEMIDELGLAILNVCAAVPDGVVVFFPSYNYLSTILTRWSVSSSTNAQTILKRLEAKKSVFRESKDVSVDTILVDYGKAIAEGKGGLLFSVVGGKMSEGINFSDALGRCVIIVGLPFPNIQSSEWKAKLAYIEAATVDRLTLAQTSTTSSEITDDESPTGVFSTEDMRKIGKDEAREFYENACMRAVNQSVGRAIRHKGDYASIVMIDQRFDSERIRNKLPGWIQGGLVKGTGEKNFGALMSGLNGFFRSKKA